MSMNGFNASVGGVFKDHDANWLYGYSMAINKDTNFKIETRFALEGLCFSMGKRLPTNRTRV